MSNNPLRRDYEPNDGQPDGHGGRVGKVMAAAIVLGAIGVGVLSWARREADVQRTADRLRELLTGTPAPPGGVTDGEVVGYAIIVVAVLLALISVLGYILRDR